MRILSVQVMKITFLHSVSILISKIINETASLIEIVPMTMILVMIDILFLLKIELMIGCPQRKSAIQVFCIRSLIE